MKKINIVVICTLFFIGMLSGCDQGQETNTDTGSNVSQESPSESGEDELMLMFDETLKEAENINSKSWFGGESFLRVVEDSEIHGEAEVAMTDGIFGHCNQYPYYGEYRLNDISIQANSEEEEEPYSLLGIEIGNSYLDAEKILLAEGYEPQEVDTMSYDDQERAAKQRIYLKYNIKIYLFLDSAEDNTANIERMTSFAWDPETPSVDYVE